MGDVRFGRYRLARLLGKGGMGQVWLARDPSGARVALKLLPSELAADAGYRTRFEREAELATTLRDPHVIRVHRHGEVDGRLFIEMDYVDGTDLAARLAEGGPLAPRVAVEILGQVAVALDTAHRAGLVHRDVKPSNILVRPDGFTYLIDFGIARGAGQTAVTATGLAIGTLAYMAPERFSGVADARTDVYSLACVLYECLTGRRPYGDTDPAQQMRGHLMTAPPRPSTVSPTIPVALDHVIARGMAKEPGDRYPTAGAFADAARTAVGLPANSAAVQDVSDAPGPGSTEVLPDATATPGQVVANPAVARRLPGQPGPTPTKVMPEPGPTPTRVQTRYQPPPVPVPLPVAHRPPVPVSPRVAYRPPVPARPPVPPGRQWYARRPVPVRPAPRGKWVAPRRRRRGGVLGKVVGALVVIFLAPFAFAAGCFALIAAGTSGGSQQSTVNRPPVVAEEDPGPSRDSGAAPAGTPVRDGKFEFTVTGVESGVSRVGFQTARGSFLIVHLDVRNISGESKWFLPLGQKLLDAGGRAVDHDSSATAWQTVSHGQGYSFELPPGQSATTQLVYDVPADLGPDRLELHDFVLSGGVTVHL